MSIVISVRVGEGLVIAADSASTLNAIGPDGQPLGVAKIFHHATKLLQLKDYPIGIATWGSGTIGSRSISSLVEEYANKRLELEQNSSYEKLDFVEREGSDLMGFLFRFYEHAYPNWQEQTSNQVASLGVLVGGFSKADFFPKEYVFNIPARQSIELRPKQADGSQDFGANWFGATEALVRFHHGWDDRFAEIMRQTGVPEELVKPVLARAKRELQLAMPFDGMPLQDAVDYALFMVNLAVGRYRFVLGPEVCGGPIDVATITSKDGFRFVRQKQIHV